MARHCVAASQQYMQRAVPPVSAPPLTLAAWVKTTNPAQNGSPMMALCHSTANGWFFLGTQGTTAFDQAQAYDGATAGIANATGTITANAWTHCCAVFTSLSARACFLNGGNKAASATATLQPSLNYLTVGGLFFNGGLYSSSWDGDLAEIGIWNAALSDAEVAQLAAGAVATAVRPANLVAYYPLLGTTSPEPDVMGGTPLTLINGPTPSPHPPLGVVSGRMFAVL